MRAHLQSVAGPISSDVSASVIMTGLTVEGPPRSEAKGLGISGYLIAWK